MTKKWLVRFGFILLASVVFGQNVFADPTTTCVDTHDYLFGVNYEKNVKPNSSIHVSGVIGGPNKSAAAHEYTVDDIKITDSSHDENVTAKYQVYRVIKQQDGTYKFWGSKTSGSISNTNVNQGIDKDGNNIYGPIPLEDQYPAFYEFSFNICIREADASTAYCREYNNKNYNNRVIEQNGMPAADDIDGCPEMLPTVADEKVGYEEVEKEDEEDIADTCRSTNGLIGWITCPLLTGLGDAITSLYEDVIADMLRLEPELLNRNGGGSSVFNAWSWFRNIANGLLVVVIIAMIFSQISGFGITNYGIKKMLPRVIISAILVNMSYIICQAAVDLSNIVGTNIGGFFDVALTDLSVSAGAIVLAVGLIAATIFAVIMIPALMPPLIMGFLGILGGVLILIISLGLRQALAIILVTVAPIAFICNILPNTQSIFKKWFDLLKGVLIAYPIASIMVYGGAMAAQILHEVWDTDASNRLLTTVADLAALIICVVPYYFIPKTITASLGAIQNMISKIQRSTSRSANRVVSNSTFMSNRMQDQADRKALRLAGVRIRNGQLVQRRGRRASQNMYLPGAQAVLNKRNRRNDIAQNPDVFRNEQFQKQVGLEEKRLETMNYSADELGEELERAQASGNHARVAACTRKLSATSDGRTVLHDNMQTHNYDDETADAMANAFSQEELYDMTKESPYIAQHLLDVKNGNHGNINYTRLSDDLLSTLSGQDYLKMDDRDSHRMATEAGANLGGAMAANLQRMLEEAQSNPELSQHINAQARQDITNFTTQRSNAVTANAGVIESGSASAISSGRFTNEVDYYQAEYERNARNGDTVGMEAAEQAFRNAATRAGSTINAATVEDTLSGWRTNVTQASFTGDERVRGAIRASVGLVRARENRFR